MSTLNKLTDSGWTATDEFHGYACDVCGARASFVRLNAPDCSTWALAGVGGAHSDAYGIYCSPACNRNEMQKEISWARSSS